MKSTFINVFISKNDSALNKNQYSLQNNTHSRRIKNSILINAVLLACIVLGATIVRAQSCYTNDFSTALSLSPTQAANAWYTDRFAPGGFVSQSTAPDGRSNTLKHSILAADVQVDDGRNTQSGSNTQGRTFDLPAATKNMEISLFISSDFNVSGRRIAGFWGTAFNSSNAISAYPIIEFTTSSDGSGPRFRGYESGTGAWVDMGLPTNFAFGQWVKLQIKLLGTGEFEYTVVTAQGALSHTTTTNNGESSASIGNVILQGYNIPTAGVSYDIFWDNFAAGSDALVRNSNTGELFCTIQAAINDSETENGHTLIAPAGIYNEEVTVNKSLIIHGANVGIAGNGTRTGESVIDGNNGAHGGFVITANNVTIDGFKIQGVAGTYGAGVHSSPTTAGLTLQNNIITDNVIGAYPSSNGASLVKNNLFDGNNRGGPAGGAGIYVESTNNLTIDGNEFRGHLNNSAIVLAATSLPAHQNLIITRNYIHDNNNTNSMVYLNGVNNGTISFNTVIQSGTTAVNIAGGNSNISIINNLLDGNLTAIKIENDGPGINTGIQAHDNSLVSTTAIQNVNDATINASCNWYGSAIPGNVSSKIIGSVSYAPFTNIGTDGNGSAAGFVPAPNSCVYLIHNITHAKDFGTIQEAINDPITQAGDVIKLDAGTFTETFAVSKSLIFEGAGKDVCGTTTRPASETILNAPLSGGTSLIGLNGAVTATFNGFKFAGNNIGNITAPNQNLTITNSVFELTFLPGANNLYFNSATLNLNCNYFKAISGTNDGSSSHIFFGGSALNVSNNKFTSQNARSSMSNSVTSLPVWMNITTSANNANIEHNEFTQIDIGILLADNAGNVKIVNNDFDGAKRETIPFGSGMGAGIAIFGNLNPAAPILIRNNSFHNSETGIRTSGSGTNFPASNLLVIGYNSFESMSDKAIRIGSSYASATNKLNALCNWFGNPSGPTITSTNEGGTGNQILDANDKVAFKNWLIYGTDAIPGEVGFQLPNTVNVSNVGNSSVAVNNYRILSNAIGCAVTGQTVALSGTFDYTGIALTEWAKGNDGDAGAADDNFVISAPTNLDNVTITGPATITGPGDVATANLEGFLSFDNGHNRNWDISGLTIKDFDLGIGFFSTANYPTNNSDVKIHDNVFYIPKDLNATAAPVDVNQNIGLHLANGANQIVNNNTVYIDGTGESIGSTVRSSSNFLQSHTTGGNGYDGLKITNNKVFVTGLPQPEPNQAVIRGIWENSHSTGSAIEISGNTFENTEVGNTANLNRAFAFWVTSRSGSGKTVVYKNNEVKNFTEGISWLGGAYTTNTAPDFEASALPVEILNNKFDGVKNAVVVRKSAGSTNGGSPAKINNNSFLNSTTFDIVNEGTGTTEASCNWFDGGALLSGTITATPKLINGTDDNSAVGFQTSAPCEFLVKNTNTGETFPTIQAAIDDEQTLNTHEIFIANGIYNERVTVSKELTLRGESKTGTVLNGTGLSGTGSGIVIENGKTKVTIQDLTIQNYTGTSGNNHAGIYAVGGNNNLTIKNIISQNNISASGIYANGPVEQVLIDAVTVANNGGSARGIVIWNGFKKNITITNSTVNNNNCCGIELQDGSASGVLIKGNTIIGNDNSIGLVGLTSGAGPNIIENNTITVNGRFGIEIKNPNGTGSTDPALDGSIIVRNNVVTFGTAPTEVRDLAGISVYRRGVITANGNVDIPAGVVITGNTVSGFVQPSTSEGFGIVVEGINHKVIGNTVSGNDVNIQRQAGHTPYTANSTEDGNQNNVADNYFGRGNAPYSCGIEVSDNGGVLSRDVMYLDAVGFVVNTTSGKTFCSIQTAVADAGTTNGHTLNVGPGTFNEQIIVNKSVLIKSQTAVKPVIHFTGTPTGKLTVFDISADGVTIENLNIKVDLAKFKSAIIATGASIDQIAVKDNLIEGFNVPLAGAYGDRNAVSVNYGGTTNYRVATGGVNNITYTGNTVTGVGTNAFRSGIAADEAAGTFTGNILQTINHDIIIRFASNGPVTISNNAFNGGGVELPEMNASAGPITISENTFNGTAANPVGAAMLRLKNNYNNIPVIVDQNTFTGHQWGISLENFQNVSLSNNSLTPLSGSTVYRHITVNTKELSSSSGFFAPVLGMTLVKNSFNGSGTTGGTALAFYNQDNDNPVFGNFTIGGSGNENNFAAGIGTFIFMDAQTGPTTAPVTTMAPWSTNIDVTGNNFDAGSGLQSPSVMPLASLFNIEDKIVHKIDNGVLGFAMVKASSTFVTPLSFTAATLTPKIQRGIDAAQAGWSEYVKAGTYIETVDINKSLSVFGSNSGINPNTGSRVPETIILPASSQPDPNITATAVSVVKFSGNTNNSVFDGFTIDGNNPNLTSGVLINGGAVDVDASEGISAYNGIANTSIVNNIVKNVNYVGVTISNESVAGVPVTTGNAITNNRFEEIRPNVYGIGVLTDNNAYTKISDNVFSAVRIGIQTGNFHKADTDLTGNFHTISNNTIEAGRKGIWHNLAYGSASNFIISGNTITAYAGSLRNDGIMISSLAGNVGTIVENNSITGIAGITNGYQLWNNPSNLVTVKGGTVNAVQHGVFANNYDGYPDATGSNAESSAYVIDGVSVTNAAIGIFVKDNTANTNNAVVKVTVNGSSVIDQASSQGLLIMGKDAQLTTGLSTIKLGLGTSNAVSITGTSGATIPNLILNTGFAINRNGNTSAPVLNTEIDAIVEINSDWSIPAGGPTFPFIIQGKLLFENGVLNAVNGPVLFTTNASDIVVGTKPEKTTSYLLGRAIMAARPVNAGAINFLGVDLPAGGDLGSLGIERITSSTPIPPVFASGSIHVQWLITPTNTSTGRTGVRFSFLTNFLNNQNAASLYAYRYNGAAWEIKSDLLTTALASGLYTTTAFNITTFSPWTLSSTSNPLPVKLVAFTANKKEQNALLNWSTSAETNSDHFDIEHSLNGKTWERIGVISARVESMSLMTYAFTHVDPANGENLYRLRMVDKDETFAYSRIVSLNFGLDGSVSFFPNPATERLQININDWSKVAKVKLIDMNGRIVYTSANAGLSKTIDVSSFIQGMYLIEIIKVDGSHTVSKIVVSK